jgi:thiol-disulfide isomerase/thioredoxin
MKKLLLFTLLLFAISFSFAQTSIPTWKITDVEKYMNSGKDEVLVINFWATFCKPCIAEIPSFIEVTNKYKDQNVKLLLVSLDLPSFYPKKIAAFAKKHNFNTNIVWLDETNADYFCPKIDVKWSGSIPATLIINPKTGFRKFFEEEIEKDKFEGAVKEAMGK